MAAGQVNWMTLTPQDWRAKSDTLAEGLIVIDDPDSILKCTNKVFQRELLSRHRTPQPKSMVVNLVLIHVIGTALTTLFWGTSARATIACLDPMLSYTVCDETPAASAMSRTLVRL